MSHDSHLIRWEQQAATSHRPHCACRTSKSCFLYSQAVCPVFFNLRLVLVNKCF